MKARLTGGPLDGREFTLPEDDAIRISFHTGNIDDRNDLYCYEYDEYEDKFIFNDYFFEQYKSFNIAEITKSNYSVIKKCTRCGTDEMFEDQFALSYCLLCNVDLYRDGHLIDKY